MAACLRAVGTDTAMSPRCLPSGESSPGNERTSVVVIERKGASGPEFLLRWSDYWGYMLPTKRQAIGTDQDPARAAAHRVVREELGIEDPESGLSLQPADLPGSDTHVLSGQIDRLAISEDAVLVIDYKTNRRPPETPVDAPEAYLRQMASYRAGLKSIFRDRKIRCALVWTEGPTLMPLDDDLLDRFAPDIG